MARRSRGDGDVLYDTANQRWTGRVVIDGKRRTVVAKTRPKPPSDSASFEPPPTQANQSPTEISPSHSSSPTGPTKGYQPATCSPLQLPFTIGRRKSLSRRSGPNESDRSHPPTSRQCFTDAARTVSRKRHWRSCARHCESHSSGPNDARSSRVTSPESASYPPTHAPPFHVGR